MLWTDNFAVVVTRSLELGCDKPVLHGILFISVHIEGSTNGKAASHRAGLTVPGPRRPPRLKTCSSLTNGETQSQLLGASLVVLKSGQGQSPPGKNGIDSTSAEAPLIVLRSCGFNISGAHLYERPVCTCESQDSHGSRTGARLSGEPRCVTFLLRPSRGTPELPASSVAVSATPKIADRCDRPNLGFRGSIIRRGCSRHRAAVSCGSAAPESIWKRYVPLRRCGSAPILFRVEPLSHCKMMRHSAGSRATQPGAACSCAPPPPSKLCAKTNAGTALQKKPTQKMAIQRPPTSSQPSRT